MKRYIKQTDDKSHMQHPIQRRLAQDRQAITAVGQFGDDLPIDSIDFTIPEKLKKSCVGIWWAIGDEIIVFTDILRGDDNTLEEGAADDGYQLDFKRFHKDIWMSEGLADKYNQPAYDFYPRGRIIYDISDEMFDIYTSKKYRDLQTDDFISELASMFHIPSGCYRSINFYQSKADVNGD